MQIILNGETHNIDAEQTISALLQEQGYDGKLVAVAVNNTFAPKSSYTTHTIHDGDKLEIVAPMQGG